MNDFEKRINLNLKLDELSKIICEKYGFGEFVDCELIKIGYEDFNFVLYTKGENYVVKIFNKSRSDEDCENLAMRAYVPQKEGFSCPKIFKCKDDLICKITVSEVSYRILVMQHIDGKDFYSSKTMPTDAQLKEIAHELAKLGDMDFKPPFIYDHWAIVNYAKEYEENIALAKHCDKKYLDKALKLFLSVDFSKLKCGFVHGDIIRTNVLKDKDGKLYFIDFSVSNYLPRIVDLAVTIGDLCFDTNSLDETKRKAKLFLSAYESRSKLSNYERECLKIFLYCHQAISVLETTRERVVESNTSRENEFYAKESKKALVMLDSEDII